jgi:putative tryptophan/tyrosine transport system substrate-binding protein
VIGTDPVEIGLVASFNRPGHNITGMTLLTTSMSAKRLELLCDLMPNVATVGLLVNPKNQITQSVTADVQGAAQKLRRRVLVQSVSSESDFETAFYSLVQQKAEAFMTSDDPIFISQREKLIALAARHAIPAIYSNRDMAVAGGLMGYGTNYPDTFRQIGIYAGRILSGTKPADLPVLQPTKFELVINLKTANALGLVIAREFLLRADEVIE